MLTRRFSLTAIDFNWVHGGIHNGKAYINLARVWSVIPHPHLKRTRNRFGCVNTFSVPRPDTTSEPVTMSDVKEAAFLCVGMEFILAHVHPA